MTSNAIQMQLPGMPKQASNAPTRKNTKSGKPSATGFNDPAFASNKVRPVHRWVPWIAGFSADFVRDAIDRYLGRKRRVILDPFSGVGTTFVEAILSGHDAIGFEINPYAALACKAKPEFPDASITEIRNTIDKLYKFYKCRVNNGSACAGDGIHGSLRSMRCADVAIPIPGRRKAVVSLNFAP